MLYIARDGGVGCAQRQLGGEIPLADVAVQCTDPMFETAGWGSQRLIRVDV